MKSNRLGASGKRLLVNATSPANEKYSTIKAIEGEATVTYTDVAGGDTAFTQVMAQGEYETGVMKDITVTGKVIAYIV